MQQNMEQMKSGMIVCVQACHAIRSNPANMHVFETAGGFQLVSGLLMWSALKLPDSCWQPSQSLHPSPAPSQRMPL